MADEYEYEKRRRRYASQPPDDYVQSRSALRERYGTRRIDARAPQSSRDMTPSGRLARARESGLSPAEATREVEDQFDALFGRYRSPQPVSGAPSGVTSASQFPDRLPNARPGFIPGVPAPESLITVGGEVPPAPKPRYIAPPPTDPTGGSNFPGLLSGNAPEIPVTPLSLPVTTPSPVAATQLASLLPQTPSTGYVPPWRKQQMQPSYMSSILSGASKYLT